MTTADAQPILSVRDLKTYFYQDEGISRAVDGVGFDLYAGRTLGVVGESGCGKSVTARSILRILEENGRVESGEICYRYSDGTTVDLAQLEADGPIIRSVRGGEIALVFQEPMTSFSVYHTVGNQMIEAIRLHEPLTKKQARERAIQSLQVVGVPSPERRIDEYPFQLSGGLRQRVMIAMALASNPRILIADEPTTALDVTTQAQILDLLRKLQEERELAVIIITHDMGVIAEMADDVVVMYLGQGVEKGTVDEIFHAPKHPYTQALLRSIPSIMAEPRTRLATLAGSIPHPYNRPKGCSFNPRCTERKPGICDVETPRMMPQANNQEVSCFLYQSEERADG